MLLGLLGGAAYQFGILDALKERFLPDDLDVVQLPALEEPAIAAVEEPQIDVVAPDEVTTSSIGETENLFRVRGNHIFY